MWTSNFCFKRIYLLIVTKVYLLNLNFKNSNEEEAIKKKKQGRMWTSNFYYFLTIKEKVYLLNLNFIIYIFYLLLLFDNNVKNIPIKQ